MGYSLLILAIFFVIAGSRGLYISLREKDIGSVERFKFVKTRSFKIISIIVNSMLIVFAILLILGLFFYRH